MEVKIILSPDEVRTAISLYLENKHGIIQEDVSAIRYKDTGLVFDKSIICHSVIEVRNQIDLTF